MSTGELADRWAAERAIEAEQAAIALRIAGTFPDMAWACRSIWREENSNNASLLWAHRQIASDSLEVDLGNRLKRAQLLLQAGNLFTAWAPRELEILLLGSEPFGKPFR
jgi:hypothetical protein